MVYFGFPFKKALKDGKICVAKRKPRDIVIGAYFTEGKSLHALFCH